MTDVNNCGLRIAPLYFVAFITFGGFIMVNLIIAVVLENFSVSKKTGGHEVGLGLGGSRVRWAGVGFRRGWAWSCAWWRGLVWCWGWGGG